MKTERFHCKECDHLVVPQWNPYDGVWECPICWEELEEAPSIGPREAEFKHTNRNPNF
jgi:hypothetical protein